MATARDLFQEVLDDWLRVEMLLARVTSGTPREERAIEDKYRSRLRQFHELTRRAS